MDCVHLSSKNRNDQIESLKQNNGIEYKFVENDWSRLT